MILSFIQTFGKCLLAVFCVRHSALRFDSRETHKVFKTSNSFLLLGKGTWRNCCKNNVPGTKINIGILRH